MKYIMKLLSIFKRKKKENNNICIIGELKLNRTVVSKEFINNFPVWDIGKPSSNLIIIE